jgi:hypothetical protein
MRMNQDLLKVDFPSVMFATFSAALASKSATGCLGGVPAKALVTASRWNCRRMLPMVGVLVVSAVRATSTLKARRAT